MARYSDEVYEYIQDCADKKITARSAHSTRTHCGKGGKVKFVSDYMTTKERNAMNGECKSYRMNAPISWEEFKTWPREHQETYIKLLRKKFNVPDKYIAEMMGISRPQFCKFIVDIGLGGGKGSSGGRRTWDAEGFYAWCGGAKDGAVKPSETPVEDGVEDADETPVEEDVVDTNETPVEEDETPVEEDVVDAGQDSVTEATDELIAVNDEPDIVCTDPVEGDCNNQTCSYTTDCREKMNSVPVIPARGTLTFENNEADAVLATLKTLLGNMRVKMVVTWLAVEEEGETRHE